MTSQEKEILIESYFEHFRRARDLALVHDINHPGRMAIEAELNRIAKKLGWDK